MHFINLGLHTFSFQPKHKYCKVGRDEIHYHHELVGGNYVFTLFELSQGGTEGNEHELECDHAPDP